MKLLLADDHTLFRDALVEYIERAEPAVLIAVAKDFPGVLSAMEENPWPDLVILDLRMPGMRGVEGVRDFRDKFPAIPVALMSGLAEEEDVRAAVALGVSGYFPKTLPAKSFLEGIYRVLGGELFLPTAGQEAALPAYYGDPPLPQELVGDIGLSPRELEVLSWLGLGVSNKEIAQSLGLQVVTVKLHVRGVCRKLGVANRTQAALRARSLGLMREARR
ncbi:MAG: response regulator transcription factor [Alphaproteobacteria bacterium]|nr:response regulator transcription factor [Alphaproteobacteria bacterium]